MLAAYLPDPILDRWLNVTINLTSTLASVFGIPVKINADIVTINGFAMRVIHQCTAFHYIIILSIAIILYTRHSIQYRLIGLLASTALIIILNAMRLVITGIVGSYFSWNVFVLVHDYLWVAAFSLLILGIWIAWVEQKIAVTIAAVKKVTIITLACSCVYGILYLTMPIYGKLMAQLASPLFSVFTNNSQSEIFYLNGRMIYISSEQNFTADFGTDLMVTALYIGLIISTGKGITTILKHGIIGLVTIISVSAALIAGSGAIAITSNKNNAVLFLLAGHGLLLALSIGLGVLITRSMQYRQGGHVSTPYH